MHNDKVSLNIVLKAYRNTFMDSCSHTTYQYKGSLKSADGNTSHNDIISRVGMAKTRILNLVPIWRDRGINQELKWD